jgi:hemolysin III
LNESGVPARPRFRGRIHQIAFIASVPAGSTLVALGRTGAARAAAAVYAVALSTLFGVSASYHRLDWSPRARARMQALDHSAIYLLIAGSYTPISVLVLEGAWRWTMLSLVWGGALAGTAIKTSRVRWGDAPGFALYLVLGWSVVIAGPQITRNLSPAQLALLVAGGVLYTVGAILFAMRRPALKPATFGFHEVWHTFVLSAALCHYAVVAALVATH